MAATIRINRLTGSGPTYTNITAGNTRASASDNAYTTETTNSILIPASGTNYSYWVTTQLEATAITGGTVDNLRWYTDGTNSFGTGVTAQVGVATGGSTATGYVQAGGTPGTSGNQLNHGNHVGLLDLTGGSVYTADPFTYTSGSPLALNFASQTSTSTTAKFGNLVVYQLIIASNASSGATTQETWTYKYDDTSS